MLPDPPKPQLSRGANLGTGRAGVDGKEEGRGKRVEHVAAQAFCLPPLRLVAQSIVPEYCHGVSSRHGVVPATSSRGRWALPSGSPALSDTHTSGVCRSGPPTCHSSPASWTPLAAVSPGSVERKGEKSGLWRCPLPSGGQSQTASTSKLGHTAWIQGLPLLLARV